MDSLSNTWFLTFATLLEKVGAIGFFGLFLAAIHSIHWIMREWSAFDDSLQHECGYYFPIQEEEEEQEQRQQSEQQSTTSRTTIPQQKQQKTTKTTTKSNHSNEQVPGLVALLEGTDESQ